MITKRYTNDANEAATLVRQGYKIVSMTYFVSNPIISFILEKDE